MGREYHHQMTTMKNRILEQVNKVEMLGCPSEEVLGGSLEGHITALYDLDFTLHSLSLV